MQISLAFHAYNLYATGMKNKTSCEKRFCLPRLAPVYPYKALVPI